MIGFRPHYTLAFLFFLLLFPSVNDVEAQGRLPIAWERNYGGSDYDYLSSLTPSYDSGYVIIGESWSSDKDLNTNKGDSDLWVLKVGPKGAIEWQKPLGGTQPDRGVDLLRTADSSFMLAGYSKSSDGDVSNNYGPSDIWLVKVDPNGSIQWEQNYGGSDSEKIGQIARLSENGFLMGGVSYSNDHDVSNNYGYQDFWVLKIDSVGNILWESNYGGWGDDVAKAVLPYSKDRYFVGGFSTSDSTDPGGAYDVSTNFGGEDVWIISVDPSNGDLLWEKNYGGSNEDVVVDMVAASGGGFFAVGYTESYDHDVSPWDYNGGLSDVWVMKLDTLGNMEWQHPYGGSGIDRGQSVIPKKDGGCVVAGMTNSTDGDVSHLQGGMDYWLLELDSTGKIEREGTYGSDSTDRSRKVLQMDTGRFMIGGESYAPSGGDVSENFGYTDFWLLEVSKSLIGIPEKDQQLEGNIFPNPAHEELTVQLPRKGSQDAYFVLYDRMGRVIRQGERSSAQFELNLSNCSSGIYFLLVQKGKRSIITKVVKK